jgi:hypothetical protein
LLDEVSHAGLGRTVEHERGDIGRLVGDDRNLRRQVDRPARSPSAFIDSAIARDREHPGAKLTLVAVEAVQIADDLEEDLSGQIFRVAGALCAQVTEHRRSEILVDAAPRPFGARSGRVKNSWETRT